MARHSDRTCKDWLNKRVLRAALTAVTQLAIEEATTRSPHAQTWHCACRKLQHRKCVTKNRTLGCPWCSTPVEGKTTFSVPLKGIAAAYGIQSDRKESRGAASATRADVSETSRCLILPAHCRIVASARRRFARNSRELLPAVSGVFRPRNGCELSS
jgi:DNA-binding helix-hairpin-helix protein with protein kinase domain